MLSEREIIIFLSLPRSISTALLMSMQTRSDLHVLHEPGLRAYNAELRASETHPESITFYEYMLKILPQDFPDYSTLLKHLEAVMNTSDKHLFIKEMIFTGRRYMDAPVFDQASFFFLIRRPENTLVSFYKESQQPLSPSLAESLNYQNMLDYIHLLQAKHRKVWIIKSEDLVTDSEETIKMICDKSNITYKAEQLSWKPFPIEATHMSTKGSTLLPGWHDVAKTSQTFDKKHIHPVALDETGRPTFNEIPVKYRQGYLDFWQNQIGFYEQLRQMSCAPENANKPKVRI